MNIKKVSYSTTYPYVIEDGWGQKWSAVVRAWWNLEKRLTEF